MDKASQLFHPFPGGYAANDRSVQVSRVLGSRDSYAHTTRSWEEEVVTESLQPFNIRVSNYSVEVSIY